MDSKYGRIFTEADVRQIVHVARLRGAPDDPMDTVAAMDDNPEKWPLTFPSNEPTFVLRAKDEAARVTLLDYGIAAELVGADADFIRKVDKVQAEFVAFAREHTDLMKIPD